MGNICRVKTYNSEKLGSSKLASDVRELRTKAATPMLGSYQVETAIRCIRTISGLVYNNIATAAVRTATG
jgi:hypothetical protein